MRKLQVKCLSVVKFNILKTMKLPSINYLFTSAKDSLKRFPLTIISSLFAAIIAVYMIEHNKEISNMFPYINLMLCFSLAIPLFICTTIITKKYGLHRKKEIILNLIALGILVGIYFTFPNKETTHNTSLPYIKFTLYSITCHLLVSFIPFILNKQLNAFWHYNKILFIRFLTSVLYSGFIYTGLIIALTSLNLLFDIEIHKELYFDIWVVVISFFNTWFFVSSIPSDFDSLEEIEEYPKGLKIFTQYVLLPLLALYLIILYTYGTKILAMWDWPKGVVSYLIIGMAILGILAFLLIHPYGNLKENSWIKKATKWYYYILIPLLIILFMAIFMRVNDYGITINRYVIVILAIWLTIVCIYTALGKTNIKFIPISLAAIAIIISFGPWGMFSFSEHSQVKRLQHILEEANILKDGKIQNEPQWITDSLPLLFADSSSENEDKLADSLHNEVKSILDYLDDHHGFSLIRDWYKQDLNALVNSSKNRNENSIRNDEAELYMKSLGLLYEFKYEDEIKSNISFTTEYESSVTKISGYDYLINYNKYIYDGDNKEITDFNIDSVEFHLIYNNTPKLNLTLKTKTETIEFDLENLVSDLIKVYGKNSTHSLPISKMRIIKILEKYEIKLEILTIEIEPKKDGYLLSNITGNLFIKLK